MSRIAQQIQMLRGQIGQAIYTSKAFTLSQREVDVFAALTENIDPMHNDPEWTKSSPWGQTIVHGLFELSLISKFYKEAGLPIYTTEEMYAMNYGLDRVRYPAPFLTDKPARCIVYLNDIIEKDPGRYVIKTTYEIFQEGSSLPSMVATYLIMIFLTGEGNN